MNYSEIIEILIRIIVGIIGVLITTLIPKFKAWLESKISAANLVKTKEYIKVFVLAAELILKEKDPTGELRKQYVYEQIKKFGLEIDGQTDALIESAVLAVNNVIKSID